MELVNSKRVLLTASYVSVELTPEERRHADAQAGRGLEKLGFIRQLGVSPAEVTRIEESAGRQPNAAVRDGMLAMATLLRQVHAPDAGAAGGLSLAAQAATVPAATIQALADRLVQWRGGGVTEMVSRVFAHRLRTAPVGQLHLERLEMYPAGTEQGELVFTVPLAPKESVTIAHKEWSTSSEEYEKIVQDYYESYSERGVAEKTDVSMATENERRHSSAFDFGTALSSSYGGVSLSVTLGLKNSAEERSSVKESTSRAREVTEKASARARQEHKVSVKLAGTHGVEDSSYRTVVNPYEDRAVRLDYYRMMRKWRTELFRYGLRLTFDVALPNPGARLWARYRHLAALDAQLLAPEPFQLTPGGIGRNNWQQLEAQYRTVLEPPPQQHLSRTVKADIKTDSGQVIEFVAEPGYTVDVGVTCILSYWGGFDSQPLLNISDPRCAQPNWQDNAAFVKKYKGSGSGDGWYELPLDTFGGDDRRTIQVIAGSSTVLVASFNYHLTLTPEAFQAWQHRVWVTLRDANAGLQQQAAARLQEERDRLWQQLAGPDTLSLRRLEREELIRNTLLWLIGADFDAAPDDVGTVVQHLLAFETNDQPDSGKPGGERSRHLTGAQWGTAAGFGDFVKFIQHAVEWENLLYFLYPYFWGSDDLAREKLLFDHPDQAHRDFLRAGYVRVVLPVRPGFEADFVRLLDTGVFAGPENSPYLSIGEEIAAYARTNYAGIPPANPEQHARPLLYPQQRQTWDAMQRVIAALEDYRAANGHYPAQLADLPIAGPFTDAWGRDLVYTIPGSGNDYDLVSYGADGEPGGTDLDADISAAAGASLMASWFQYTPTSGLDIDLVVKPAIL
jgi:hypothetical protein